MAATTPGPSPGKGDVLGWIRGKRFDIKTTFVVIALALAIWFAVVYVNIRDFVPDELTEPAGAPR